MNWDDARIFLAVARAGQILGAARRLDLNHATVSRRIAALEAALDAKLFRRHTAGSELTPAGERFLGVAERMEADMIAARAEIAGDGERWRARCASARRMVSASPIWRRASARSPPSIRICRSSWCRCRARSRCRAARPISPSPSTGRPRAGWSPQSSPTIRSASMRRAPMPNGMACRKVLAELSRHMLVGYVPDLVASPSLDYAAEFSPAWNARFSISSSLGQVEAVRSGAGIGMLHAFIARAIPELVPVTAADRSAAPTGWSITRACARCAACTPWRTSSPSWSRRIARCLADVRDCALRPAPVPRGTRSACGGLRPTAPASRSAGSP